MLHWLFMGALGSLLVANSSCIQDVKRDCKHNEVFHREFNGRYQLDFKAAEELCRSLGATLATQEQLERAHAAGYETCRYGWIQEQLVALPRVHAHPSCGKNITGVYTISRPLSSKYDAFCYKDGKSCTLENSPTDIPTIPPHPVEIGKQNFTAHSQNRMFTSLPTTSDRESTMVPLAEDRGGSTGTTVGADGPFAPVQTDPWSTSVLPLSEAFTESASPNEGLTRRTSAAAPGFTRKVILSSTRPEHLLNSLPGSPRTNTIEVVDGSGSAAWKEPYTESAGQTPLIWDDHMTKLTSGTDFSTTGSTALPSPPFLPLDDSPEVNLSTEAELQANHVTEIPFAAELQSEPEVDFTTIRSTALPSPLASDSSPTLAAAQEREEHTELVSEELIKAEPHSDGVLMTTGSTTPPSPPTALADNSLRYSTDVYKPDDESNSLNSHSDPGDFLELQLSTESDLESTSGLFTSQRLTNLPFDPAAVTVLDAAWAPSSSPSSESRGHPADSENTPEILDFSPTEILLDHSTGLSNELRLAASASAETSVPFGESGSTSDVLSSETQETATRFPQEITINTELAAEPTSQPPDINTSKRTFDPPVESTLQAVDFDLTQFVRPPDHSSAVAMPSVTTQEPVTSTLPPSPEVPPIVPSTTAEKKLHEMGNQIEPSPHTTVQPKHTSPELSGTTKVYSTAVFGPTTSLPITTGQVYQVSSSTMGQKQTDRESIMIPLAEDRGGSTGTTVGADGPFAPVQTDPWSTSVLPLSEAFTESASPNEGLTRLTSAAAPGFTRKVILSSTRPEYLLNSLPGSPRTNTIEVVDGSGSAAWKEPYTESAGQTPLIWDDHMTKLTSGTDFSTTGSTALPSPPFLPLDDSPEVNLSTEAELQANHVTEIPFAAELQSEPEVDFTTIRSTALPSPLASDSSPTLAAAQEREEHTELVSEELIKAEPHSDGVLMTTGSTTPPSPPTALADNSLRYSTDVYKPDDESNSLNSHSDPGDFLELQLSTESDLESTSGLFTSQKLTNLPFDPAAVTVLDAAWAPSSSPSSESRGHPADSENTPEILDFSPTEILLDHSTGLSNELRLAASASAETSVPFGESGSTSDVLSSETQETATRFPQEITINTELAAEPTSQPPDINTSKRTFDPPVESTLQAVDFDLTQFVRPPDHSSAVAMPSVTTQEPVTSTLPPSPEVPPIVPSTTAEKKLHEMGNQIEPSPHTTVQPKHTSPELSGTTKVYSTAVFGPTTSLPITTGQVYQVSSSTMGQKQTAQPNVTEGSNNIPLTEEQPGPTAMGKKSLEAPLDWLIVAAIVVSLLIILLGGLMIIYSKRLCGRKKSLTITKPGEDGVTAMEKGASNGRGEDADRQGELKAEAKGSDEWIQLIDKKDLDIIPESTEAAKLMTRDESGELPNIEMTATTQDQVNRS